MKTEQEIIYTIWDVVRGGEFNQDDNINERLMRSFLSIHRGKSLDVFTKKGTLIPDECFQDLGSITFTLNPNGEYVSLVMPKIIRFRHNQGLMMSKGDYTISIMNSEEYHNAPKDKFNKFQPKLKFINRILTFDLGQEQICNQIEDLTTTLLNTTVRNLKEEANQSILSINGMGVLVNPDDEPAYDWLSSPYPMPDELVENLINSITTREFGIFLRMKSDETGDIRSNVAEYNTREEL